MTHVSDVEADRLRNRDPELFRVLIREHTGPLLGWVRSYADSPDEADDLVQEVWRRVLEKRETYRGTGSFRGWLFQVSRTVCLDHARRQASRRRSREQVTAQLQAEMAADVRAQATSSPTAAAELLETDETHAAIRSAVEALPPRQRDVVTLRILEGMSTKEAAAILACAEGTVKASLSHALSKLREQLRPGTTTEDER